MSPSCIIYISVAQYIFCDTYIEATTYKKRGSLSLSKQSLYTTVPLLVTLRRH